MAALIPQHASRGSCRLGATPLLLVAAACLLLMTAVGPLPAGKAHPPAATPPAALALQQRAPNPATPGSTSIPVGSTPTQAVYDAMNGYVYIVNMASDSVSVIGGSAVVATVTVGSYPVSAVYDSSNGFIYVLNYNGAPPGTVSVVNGTALVATVTVGNDPYAGTFDSTNGFVYVANEASGTVSIINGTKLEANVSVGPMPEWATYDAVNGLVYVGSSYGSSNISVLNGTHRLGTVDVGGTSQTARCDGRSGWLYVPRLWNNSVSVVNGTRLVASVPVGSVGSTPGAALYNPGDDAVYVTDPGDYSVSILKGVNVTATVYLGATPGDATTPTSIGYDGVDGFVYVLNPIANVVSVLNGTRVIGIEIPGSDPVSVAYDAANGRAYVVNEFSGNVTVLPAWYRVTATETGLPAGSAWWFNVSGNPIGVIGWYGTGSSITFRVPNGSYVDYLGSDNPAYGGSAGTFAVRGSPTALNVSFQAVVYTVTFLETGLPRGTSWSVRMAGTAANSTSTSLTVSATYGWWNYTVGLVPGWNCSARTGSLDVTYPLVVNLAWSEVTYPVRLHETGLPAGTGWGVLVGNLAASALAPNVSLPLPNGTYGFVILPVQGYESNGSGTFVVNGSPVNITVAFHRQLYPVVFVEFGLPAGSNWSVTATNRTMGVNVSQSASTNSIVLFLPNGTFLVTFTLPPGFSGNVSSTQITVEGRATSGPTWTLTQAPRTPSGSTGSPEAFLPWVAAGAAAIAAAVGSILGYRWRARERQRGVLLVDELFRPSTALPAAGSPEEPSELEP